MKRFLTAEWRHLVMLNYELDREALAPYVPAGTELDTLHGRTLASMVGFMFQRTRVAGLAVPGHTRFEEVNLRFYVRRMGPDGMRRGVVFIREIVPRRAIAAIARGLYGEHYIAMPMRHEIDVFGEHGERGIAASYGWRASGRWHELAARADGPPCRLEEGSEEEFITEHYWGYVRGRGGETVEYRVAHPRWRVWRAIECRFDCDVASIYGDRFVESLTVQPVSAFIAEGSPVEVYRGERL